MARQCPSLRSGHAYLPPYPALRRRRPSSRQTWMSDRLLLIGWACPSQWPRRQRGMLPWRRGLPSSTLVSITAPMDSVRLSYQQAQGCVAPPPPAPTPPSAKRRQVRAQPILPSAPDIERRRQSLLALRATVGGSPSSGAAGEGSSVRQRRAQLGVLTRSPVGREPAAS